jgi:hypothetical protein
MKFLVIILLVGVVMCLDGEMWCVTSSKCQDPFEVAFKVEECKIMLRLTKM